MRIIYKADDGTEFESREQCEKYDQIHIEHVQYTEIHDINLIPPREFPRLFEIGYIDRMYIYVRDLKDGSVDYNSYETYSLDETGHLDCTDPDYGCLGWSGKDNCYYRTVHGYSWKVDVLGVKNVSYR